MGLCGVAGGAVVVIDTGGSWYDAFDTMSGDKLGIVAANDCNPVDALSTAPDGDRITLATSSGLCGVPGMTLSVIRVDTRPTGFSSAATEEQVVAESPGRIEAATWSPDGQALLDTASRLSLPTLAADSQSFAAAQGRLAHTPEGPFELDGDVIALRWSPDAGSILAATSAGSVWSVDRQTATPQPLVADDPNVLLLGWSPSGNGPQFLRGCGEDGVVLWETAEGHRCLDNVASASWSPNDDLLLLEGRRLHVADLTARQLQEIGPGTNARWLPPAHGP